jgi:hypothetical protein
MILLLRAGVCGKLSFIAEADEPVRSNVGVEEALVLIP